MAQGMLKADKSTSKRGKRESEGSMPEGVGGVVWRHIAMHGLYGCPVLWIAVRVPSLI